MQSSINYYEMFQSSPVSIWQEDFTEVKQYFDRLHKKGIQDLKTYLHEYPEKVLDLAKMVKIVDVNKATLDLFQAQSKQELYEGLAPIFNKKSYDVFRDELVALSKGKTRFSSEAVNRTLKGEERHLLLNLFVAQGFEKSLSCVFVHIIDISPLKRREEKLRNSEQKYRALIESAHDAIVLADAETGIICEANKRSEQIIGIPQHHIIGMHLAQLHETDDPNLHKKIVQNHRSGRIHISENMLVSQRNTDKVPVSVHARVISIKEKKYIAATFRERKPEHLSVTCGLIPDHCVLNDVPPPTAVKKLSNREQEIMKLIASGLGNKQISARLNISIKTVETHRARIMEKLGAHKTADLVRFSICSGLLKSNPPEI